MLTRLIEILLCSFLILFSAQLHSHAKVDYIRLANGKRYCGSLGLADKESDVRIVTIAGEQVVRAIDIIELRPIEDTLEQRMDIRLGVL